MTTCLSMVETPAARLGRGALSGTLATGVMSLFMLGAHQAHWLGKPPPKKLTDRLVRLMGGKRRRASWPMTALQHAAFGAAAGVPFALVAGRTAPSRALIFAGGLYGAAIWAAMYQGVLPALGFMPRPSWDRPGRPTSMVVAHLIYGAALGGLVNVDLVRTAPEFLRR